MRGGAAAAQVSAFMAAQGGASSRSKGPRAQATETLPPFCKRFLQCRCCCGMCIAPASSRLRGAGSPRGLKGHMHVGSARGRGARIFVAAFALARIFF